MQHSEFRRLIRVASDADPVVVLRALADRADARRLRLFTCGCCRRNWDKLIDARSRQAVETGERFADGLCTDADREAAHVSALVASRGCAPGPETLLAMQAARCVARNLNVITAQMTPAETTEPDEKSRQCDLLRDIFGNPFRPVRIDQTWKEWNDATVVHLARALYDERRFADLPILADALEEAGCLDKHILTHCRQPALHVRGCWVLDALLR